MATSNLESGAIDPRPIQNRIRIRIPKTLQQEPVISQLVSQHGLMVTITAALLGANARDDGWFDLLLQGSDSQIRSGILYLNDLNIEIWQDSDGENSGW